MRTSLIAIVSTCFAVAAAAAPPSIESVAPPVGQRGQEFIVTFTGSRLAEPKELLLYSPGLTCTKLDAKSDTEVVATIRAARDCRLGEYPFRLQCRSGMSELRILRVSPFPIVTEVEPNDELGKAQTVSMNSTVVGSLDDSTVDVYSVLLKKGQRFAAEVEGVRLGSQLTDTELTIFAPDGKVLATADDTPLFRQDPFATMIAPADGVYSVRVRESGNGGGDAGRYALHIGDFCRPAAIFPAGGQAGSTLNVTVFGDAAGTRTQSVTIPALDQPFEFFAKDEKGPAAPTPNPFRVSAFPNVLEPTAGASSLKPVAWPVAFNGVLSAKEEIDSFPFRAGRGDQIDVSVFAYRIGSPLDSIVEIRNERGTLIAVNDDDDTHDSRVFVTIPADGIYTARIADKRKQGGPGFIYRIELDAVKPSLTAFLPQSIRKSQNRQVVMVPRGNRTLVHFGVRRDGFDGPVTLSANGLPNGLTATIPTIAAGEYLAPVAFEAKADAPLGGTLAAIRVVGRDSSRELFGSFRQTINLVAGPGDSSFHDVDLERLAITVTDEAPYRLHVGTPTTTVAPDGTLDLIVRVDRQKGFEDAIELSFPLLPPGIEAPTTVVVPADKKEVTVTLVAHPPAVVGAWRFAAEGKVSTGPGRGDRDALMVGNNGLGTPTPGGRRSRRSPVSSPPVSTDVVALTVAPAPISGQFIPSAGEQGKSVRVECEIAATRPTTGTLTASLDGLPPRATSKPVKVEPNAKRVTFVVSLDPTTPAAEYRSLVCQLSGTVDGHAVQYRLGRGGVLRVDTPGGVKSDASGKPLSPLDSLRLESSGKSEPRKP